MDFPSLQLAVAVMFMLSLKLEVGGTLPSYVYRSPTPWGAAICAPPLEELNFPRYHMTSYGRRAFSYAGLHTWNSLPEHLRQTTPIELFKRSL